MSFKRLAILAAAIAVPGLATAETPNTAGPLQIDSNKDGKISKTEFVDGMLPKVRERLSSRFDMLDANRDGMLDDAEMRGHKQMHRMHQGMMPAPQTPAPQTPAPQ